MSGASELEEVLKGVLKEINKKSPVDYIEGPESEEKGIERELEKSFDKFIKFIIQRGNEISEIYMYRPEYMSDKVAWLVDKEKVKKCRTLYGLIDVLHMVCEDVIKKKPNVSEEESTFCYLVNALHELAVGKYDPTKYGFSSISDQHTVIVSGFIAYRDRKRDNFLLEAKRDGNNFSVDLQKIKFNNVNSINGVYIKIEEFGGQA